MQLNQGRFLQNGGCGYVLKPPFMLHANFNPYSKELPPDVEPVVVTVKVRLHIYILTILYTFI